MCVWHVAALRSFFGVVTALSLLSLSALVCVGFKTEWSALILTVTLGVSNIWMCASRAPPAFPSAAAVGAYSVQPVSLLAARRRLRQTQVPVLVRPRAAVRLL